MKKGENKFAKGNKLRDKMMKISQSEVKIIKEVDTITSIRADSSLYDFDICYQLSSSTQTFQNRYVDENGVQCMLEEVLSSAVMEAVYKRYFRFFSTIVHHSLSSSSILSNRKRRSKEVFWQYEIKIVNSVADIKPRMFSECVL